MKALVVFYSRSGITKKVSEEICGSLECDMEEILEPNSRKGFFGYIGSCYQAARKKLPEIKEPERDLSDYEIVIIGSPTWVGTMASPVRTYLTSQKNKVHKAAFFATSGNGKEQKVFRDMKEILEKKPIVEIMIGERKVKSGDHENELKRFVKKIKKAMSRS